MPAVRIAVLLLSVICANGAPAAPSPGDAAHSDRVKGAPPSATAKTTPNESMLDLGLLKKRLKETEAIGFFTKLTLKNEVDDLLERFRAFYEGRSETTPQELRRPYETLILKVLSLLQDSDPSLAKDIARSREALWAILTDREQFARL